MKKTDENTVFSKGRFIMKKFFSLMTVVLVMGFISMLTVSAEQTSIIELTEINGEVIQDSKELQEKSNFLLDELKIEQEEGKINGYGVINKNGEKSKLPIEGELYPVLEEGYYKDDLLVGDINSTERYNVLQFEMKNMTNDSLNKNGDVDYPQLYIILEDKSTGEWIRFKQSIDKRLFNKYFENSKLLVDNKEINELELKEKIIYLLNIHNKAEYGENIAKSVQVKQSGTEDTEGIKTIDKPITTQMDNISVNFSELNKMLKDLKSSSNSTVNLSDYNLPESLFKGSGWKKDVNLNNSPGWGYYAASADQGPFTITQITSFQHEGRFGSWDNLKNDYTSIMRLQHGMAIEYDHATKDIKVLVFDLGITLRDLHLAQEVRSGNNEVSVFTSQDLQGERLTQRKSGPLIKFVAGKIPYGDRITDVWDILSNLRGEEKKIRD